jgi:hypothetical protein
MLPQRLCWVGFSEALSFIYAFSLGQTFSEAGVGDAKKE